MAGREADVAIRKHYFEDTILILGEFDILGHDMHYTLRVSSFGSRTNGQKLQIYFGLLDETMREFTETRYLYDSDNVIIDRDQLLIRTEHVEIRESFNGVKVYVEGESLTLDFTLENDGHRSDIRSLERMDVNNRTEGYSYPYCLTEGTALIGNNYSPVHGTAYYIRRFQNRPGRFDKRTGQTSILRGFSRNESDNDDSEGFSLYGFFVLSNGRRLFFGSFGNDSSHDDICIVTSGSTTYEKKIEPIQNAIVDVEAPEQGSTDSGANPPHPDKDVTVRVTAADGEFYLKARRVLNLTEDFSPEKKDLRQYDRFVRATGKHENERIVGYGYMTLS